LAYGFFNPAMMKLKDINSIAEWFGSMGIPMPTLNAYLATGTEIFGVILLTLGLFSRIISIPLIITMIVAIVTVHGENGFDAGNNGFEIPLYYMIMLFTLLVYGSGKISLDHLFFKNKEVNNVVK
jgi:putative oxidoreductase